MAKFDTLGEKKGILMFQKFGFIGFKMPPKINDLFFWCNNIDEIRKFYSQTLGLKEKWIELDKSSDGSQYVVFELSNGQNLHFICRNENHQINNSWSYQPSSEISDGIEKISFTMEFSQNEFENITNKIFTSEYLHFQNEPDVRSGYTALTVMDPMGNTIDLYFLH